MQIWVDRYTHSLVFAFLILGTIDRIILNISGIIHIGEYWIIHGYLLDTSIVNL